MFKITKWTAAITDDKKDKVVAEKPENMPFLFRLKDDDDIIYAYGYASTNDDEDAFAPLYEWGQAYGCTSIEYFSESTGEWEQL